jgi:hypothetical protein
MNKEAYEFLQSLDYLRNSDMYYIHTGGLDARDILHEEDYKEYCTLNEEYYAEPIPFTPLTKEQINACESTIAILEANIKANKANKERVARDRLKHNKQVTMDYKLKK